MTVQQLQLILDSLWQRFGQAGDKCGVMFKLADLVAIEESKLLIKSQNFSHCQIPFNHTLDIKKSAQTAQTS